MKLGGTSLAKYNFPHAEIFEAGETLGLPAEAPFDKILVSAANESVPQELIDQLKVGGTMVIPIQNAIWKIYKASRTENKIEKYEGFRFVPLMH